MMMSPGVILLPLMMLSTGHSLSPFARYAIAGHHLAGVHLPRSLSITQLALGLVLLSIQVAFLVSSS